MRNQNRPECCIVECYTYKEVIEFYNEYLSNVKVQDFLRGFVLRFDGFGKIEQSVGTVSKDLLCQAHKYNLNNTDEVQSYINEHMNYVGRINPFKSKREKWVIDEHNKSFIKWFRN